MTYEMCGVIDNSIIILTLYLYRMAVFHVWRIIMFDVNILNLCSNEKTIHFNLLIKIYITLYFQ